MHMYTLYEQGLLSLSHYRAEAKSNVKKGNTATQQLLAWCQHKTKYYEVRIPDASIPALIPIAIATWLLVREQKVISVNGQLRGQLKKVQLHA